MSMKMKPNCTRLRTTALRGGARLRVKQFTLCALILAALLLLTPRCLVAQETANSLSDSERAAFLSELQPLQDRLAVLRKSPDVSPDRWADAQIFVKAVRSEE